MPTQQEVEAYAVSGGTQGRAPSLAPVQGAGPTPDAIKNSVAQPAMPRTAMAPGPGQPPSVPQPYPAMAPGPGQPPLQMGGPNMRYAQPQTTTPDTTIQQLPADAGQGAFGGFSARTGFPGTVPTVRHNSTNTGVAPDARPPATGTVPTVRPPGGNRPVTTGPVGLQPGDPDPSGTGTVTPITQGAPPVGGTAPGSAPGFAPTSAIDPFNPSLRGREIAFNVPAPVQVQPDQVKTQALDSFNAQIPGMDAALESRVRDLSRSTAAMGRTGSGLHDRAFRGIEAQERGAREGLLGSMTMQGALADQNANLTAGLAHQPLAQQYGLAGMAHQYGERREQNSLANEAMDREAQRIQFLNQGGFGSDPTNAFLGAAAVHQQGSAQYGANASEINNQIGNTDLASQFIPKPVVGPNAPVTQQQYAQPRRQPATYAGDRT